MKTVILKYGFLLGLVCSFFLFFGKLGKRSGGPDYSLTMKIFFILFVLVLGYLVAIRELRKKQGGYLELSEGMQTGFGITTILSIFFSIASYIYFKFYLFNDSLRQKLQDLSRKGSPGRVTDTELTFWHNLNLDPLILAFIALVVIGVTGLILTFFIANAYKKSRENI